MSVNDFEKQAQQKMDELQIRPSDAVWTEVEKLIRKKKKRRRIIVWFLLFGLILMGGSVWWITGGKKEPLTGNESISPEKQKNELESTEKKSILPQAKTQTENVKKTVPKDEPNINSKISEHVVISKNIRDPKIIISQVKPSRKETDKPTQPKGDVVKSKDLPDVKAKLNDQSLLSPTNKSDADPLTNKKINDTTSGDTTTVSLAGIGNLTDKLPPAPDTTAIVSKTDTVSLSKVADTVSKKDPGGKKSKWEWGFTLEAGLSSRSNGISIFNMQKSADVFAIPGGSGQQPVVAPEEPTKGFSWQAGFYTRRKLSSRTGISAGLEFTSFSTRQRTGAFVDSSRVVQNNSFSSVVGDFYRTGNRSTYTNHYYYLQLPLLFHWQINKNSKSPLVWQNGFSIGVLTGSDALVYSDNSNLYYHDNRLLNKFRLAYQSGLSIRLFNRSAHPFTAGLNFYVPLSQVQKINSDDRNRLASVGIQFGWILKK